ncbi:MAG: hypothetical protein ACT4PM_00200, partial [Gemmatimonadales bacterium]
VAVWFLITDVIQGRPLSTPSVLGQVILYGITTPEVYPPQTGPVVAYTFLHVGAFVIFGIVLTELVHLAMSSPLVRFGLMIVAVCFEVFFVIMTFAVFSATRYLFPWWSVLAANTLSLAGMGLFLARRHPGLKRQFQREPLGA